MLGKKLNFCCTRLKNHHHHQGHQSSQNTPPNSQNPLHIPKHFNSLYDPSSDDGGGGSESLTGFGSRSGSTSRTLTTTLTTTAGDDDVTTDSEPDLSTVFASRRLIRPASTGRSNSIVEEENSRVVVGFGAVPKMSPDPYGDFKRSMEEMVEAMGLSCAGGGEEQRRLRMQELLLCYLALNQKNAHGYIVGAFADVLRGLSAVGD